MYHVKITGTGMYAPETVVKNQYFNDRFGIDVDEHIRPLLGYVERRWAKEEESAASMGQEAARNALHQAGIKAQDLDMIVVATDTPEYISPATAHVIQDGLGAKNARVWDMNAACAGFVIALDTACRFLQTDDTLFHAMVIGTYNMTKYLNHDDVQTSSLFADGAGAVIVSRSATPGYLSASHIADGSYHDYMGIYAGGTKFPLTPERIAAKDHLLKFAKRFPGDTNSSRWPNLVEQTLAKANHLVQEIDLALFTQINLSVIKEVMQSLALPMEKTHTIMDRYGYTGSACIPMALHDALNKGKLKREDLLVVTASGGGYSMASVAFRY